MPTAEESRKTFCHEVQEAIDAANYLFADVERASDASRDLPESESLSQGLSELNNLLNQVKEKSRSLMESVGCQTVMERY
jgi:hypothetical protein